MTDYDHKTTERMGGATRISTDQPRAALVFYHRDGTDSVELADGSGLIVGRAHPAQLQIPDPSLSRMHARFVWSDGVLRVTDLDSTNGTSLAGERVKDARVRSGDELLLGEVSVSVHVLSPREAIRYGIESYGRTLTQLSNEIVRARGFERCLSLAMIRSSATPSHLARLAEELRQRLRPMDQVGVYDARTALVLMPELEASRARSSLEPLLSLLPEAQLQIGLATFPEAASSDQALLSVARAACLSASPAQPLVVAASPAAAPAECLNDTVVRDPKMLDIYRTLRQVAKTPVPVLIVGETGVGKEVLVAELHRASRRTGAFKVINCATIPRELTESILFGHERGAFTGAQKRATGIFEDADGGTLFLDEVGDLALSAQAALLRVLEEGRFLRVGSTAEVEIDVRVVAATHRDLAAMVATGDFREDLFYRLNTITIDVPPLRARPSEIRPLAEFFARTAASEWGAQPKTIDPAAMMALEQYAWPGNIRQLRNVIERAVALSDSNTLHAFDLPQALRPGGSVGERPGPAAPTIPPGPPTAADSSRSFKDRVQDFERDLIVEALAKTGSNISQAARLLGMPTRTLFAKVRNYGLKQKPE